MLVNTSGIANRIICLKIGPFVIVTLSVFILISTPPLFRRYKPQRKNTACKLSAHAHSPDIFTLLPVNSLTNAIISYTAIFVKLKTSTLYAFFKRFFMHFAKFTYAAHTKTETVYVNTARIQNFSDTESPPNRAMASLII